jgi:flagella basal body P-ring formation protein FlgA
LTLTGCLVVSAGADHILAGDLAAAIPGFTAPAPRDSVALAPAPGVQRVFRVPELRRLAQSLHWEIEPLTDICFERPASPPDPTKMLQAMQKSLPQAAIAILDYSRQPLPEGDLEFPASGLRPGNGGAFWAGYVKYAEHRRFATWARVHCLVTVTRLIAVVDLPAGKPVTAEQVRAETRQEFPLTARFLQSSEEAVGKWPRMGIRPGTEIRLEMVEDSKQVACGETVVVDVRSGGAHLEFEARAEASGAVGETIPILNPQSNKRFVARVEGKGRVSVILSAAQVKP